MKSKHTIARDIQVTNSRGIHARPASLIAKAVSHFDSEIVVEKDGQEVSGRDVMGLLSLEAHYGSVLHVTAEGTDATYAMDELEALMANELDLD